MTAAEQHPHLRPVADDALPPRTYRVEKCAEQEECSLLCPARAELIVLDGDKRLTSCCVEHWQPLRELVERRGHAIVYADEVLRLLGVTP